MHAPARRVVHAFALLLLVVALAPPADAVAAYERANVACGGQRGSGQADAAGNLYVPCTHDAGAARPHVRVYDKTGVRRLTIPLPAVASDVAPSADGSLLFVNGQTSKAVTRYVRQATGAYVLDPMWRLASYPQWGTDYRPLGEFIATDGQGFLYVSSGTWTTAPTSIVKYRADGSMVTQFGSWDATWNTGSFYWMATGLVPTRDGASVYVAEVGNNRIQRFDRQADGSYLFARVLAGNDPALDEDPRTGWCGTDVRHGRLAAPYDVGLDGAGNVHVLNTTCVQVKVFAPDGTHRETVQLTNPRGGYVHGMAVDPAGRVYLPELDTALYPTGTRPAAGPVPIAANFSGYAIVKPADGTAWAPVWRWTANGWAFVWWPKDRRIWVQPYAAGWMWAWYDGSWHAMRTGDLVA